MTFKGVNTIANNTGFDGGGVFLDSSYIAFAPQSKLHILNNRAKKRGGGIYGSGYFTLTDLWKQSLYDIIMSKGKWNVMCAF